MLQPEFVRDIQSNYMKLFAEAAQSSAYETAIVRENQIPGLLPCKISRMDHRTVYAYEISNTQSLKGYYAHRDIGERELLHILKAIDQILSRLQPYLLDPAHLLLEPEYIFLEPDAGAVLFCYYPAYEGEVRKALCSLSDYFIEKLNHNDKGAVQLGYLFFRKSREDNFNLSHMLRTAAQPARQAEVSREEKNGPETAKDPAGYREVPLAQSTFRTAAAGAEGQPSRETEYQKRQEAAPLPVIPPAETFFPDLEKPRRKNGLFSLRNRGEKTRKAGKEPQGLPQNSPLPVYAVEKAFFQGEESLSQPAVVRDGGSRPEDPGTGDGLPPFARLKAIDGSVPGEFLLDQLPYIIGTLSYAVDGLLEYEDVGRFQARIQKSGDGVVLLDLNSPQGTYLNGTKCRASREYPLKNGDEVRFGAHAYRYVE